MAFVLRPFIEEYSEAVLAIAHAAIPYDPEGNQRWLRERKQIDEQLFRRRHYVVVDTDTHDIVGYGAIEQQGSDPPQRLRLYLIVLPGYLRSGVGRALYGRLMSDVETLKVSSLWMQEYQQDTELLGFVQERGFVQTSLIRELRLTLAKANITQMVSIVDRVAARGIIISSLEEERLRSRNIARRLHDLYNAVLDDVYTPLTFQDFVQRLDRPRIMPQGFFIARKDDRLIGLSALAYIEGDPEQALQHWTGVLPDFRRQGIATALRLCTIDAALRLGYKTLTTFTNHSEPITLALNEKLGFHRLFAYVILEKTVQNQS
ncbi:MAG TPA: GNAT family N-acetyltransferase [Ktedonobacterales bacterium]|jgi:GNAT superfamily N-acetyltransferase